MNDLSYLQHTIDAELLTYKEFRPDIIFTENQFSVAISARLAALPYATTAATVNLPHFESPLYDDGQSTVGVEVPFNKILHSYGLAPVNSICELYHGFAAANFAPTIPEFEPALAELPRVQYVGPILDSSTEISALPELASEALEHQPIYVYMSVGVLPPETYVPILAEVAKVTGLYFIVALRQSHYCEQTLPTRLGSVFLFDMVPGLTMIKRSRLVITRGGQNTLMCCVLAEKPVLGFPGHSAEAHFNLVGLEQTHLVRTCVSTQFTAEQLCALIHQTLEANTHVESADWASRLRQAGRQSEVVASLERCLL
jgi:UDP:flavonoid glycosyltransferase YjiC (YdhE family)